MDIKKLLKIIIPAILALVIGNMAPLAEGLTVESMRFAGLFICMILWMVFNVWPDFVVTLVGLTACVVWKASDFGTLFAPFAGTSVWLVIGAFGMGAGVIKSGLMKRMAYAILSVFPESFKGQVLAILTAGLAICPFIPSLNAKAAILAPFAGSVSEALGYEKSSKGAKGLYNAVVIITTVIGMAFMSGAVPVATLIGMMPEADAASMTWMKWFSGAAVWMVVVLVLTFVSILVLYTPKEEGEVKESGLAKKNLEAMGPMSKTERITGVILVLALLGWMTSSLTGLNATIVAMIALLAMFVFGIMEGPDFKNSIAWGSVIFIGTVYTLASMLSKLGWSSYIAKVLTPVLGGIASNIWLLVPVICVVTYLLRTVVVSQTAAITIIWAIFGSIGASYGIGAFPILFTGYLSTLVWHYAGNNVTTATCEAATNGKMVEFKDTFQMNVVYMVINLIACMASIPVWKILGMC